MLGANGPMEVVAMVMMTAIAAAYCGSKGTDGSRGNSDNGSGVLVVASGSVRFVSNGGTIVGAVSFVLLSTTKKKQNEQSSRI